MFLTSGRTRIVVPLAIICLLLSFNGFSVIHDLSVYTPDSARYMVWAQSLAHGNGFTDATGPEVQRYVVHAPLYALLLAPVSFLFPGSLEAAKSFTLFLGIGATLLIWYWLRRVSNSRAGVIAAFFFAVNALVVLYSTEVLSDVPFALALVIVFILNEASGPNVSNRSFFMLGLVIAAGMLLREVGTALFLCQLLYFVYKKEYRGAGVVAVTAGTLFLLWMVRNEVIVAGIELPAFTNGKLFTRHFLTPESGPFAAELIARIGVNSKVYLNAIGGLLFYPTFGGASYDLVFRNSASAADLYPIVHVLAVPLTMISAAGVMFGCSLDRFNSKAWALKVLFLALYGSIILCYPINDVRFLFPVLVIGIYYSAMGFDEGARRLFARFRAPVQRMALGGVLLVVAFPSTVWTRQYASAVQSYRRFFTPGTQSDTLRAGSVFAKPVGKAAEWIASHTESGAVIISQSKDLAYAIGAPKLLNLNETVPLGTFEQYLRDYHVAYIAVSTGTLSIPEFGFQMAMAKGYEFHPVWELGNIAVCKVFRRNGSPDSSAESTEFETALHLLDQGLYDSASERLDRLLEQDSLNYAALFYSAVAKEFGGHPGAAKELFGKFRTLPQSGMYLEHSASHLSCMRDLLVVDGPAPGSVKAEQLTASAGAYWEMGFRSYARELLRRAAGYDSACFPAALYGMYFALETRDTVSARGECGRMAALNPGAKAVAPMRRIFDLFDSLRSTAQQDATLLEIAGNFVTAGLTEDAIDTYLAVVHRGANRMMIAEGKSRLADLYLMKRRFAPAAELLHQLASESDLSPDLARSVAMRIEGIRQHF